METDNAGSVVNENFVYLKDNSVTRWVISETVNATRNGIVSHAKRSSSLAGETFHGNLFVSIPRRKPNNTLQPLRNKFRNCLQLYGFYNYRM